MGVGTRGITTTVPGTGRMASSASAPFMRGRLRVGTGRMRRRVRGERDRQLVQLHTAEVSRLPTPGAQGFEVRLQRLECEKAEWIGGVRCARVDVDDLLHPLVARLDDAGVNLEQR